MLIYLVDDLVDEWLPAFSNQAGHDARKLFATQIGRQLRFMEDAPQRTLWVRWLKRYWNNRINVVLRCFATDEVRGMSGWLSHFDVSTRTNDSRF